MRLGFLTHSTSIQSDYNFAAFTIIICQSPLAPSLTQKVFQVESWLKMIAESEMVSFRDISRQNTFSRLTLLW